MNTQPSQTNIIMQYCCSTDSYHFNSFVAHSPFRRYIKHANIIEKCFPAKKTDEPKPLSNELSYLTYYTKSKPVKLAKVGKYLYGRLLSDLSSGKSRDVLVEILIFKAILESNSKDIYFFGENLLLSVIAILRSKNLELIFEAADLTSLFCMYHNGTTAVISSEFRAEYNTVISMFTRFLSPSYNTQYRLQYQTIGFNVLNAVLSCQDTYSNENTDERSAIVYALFDKFWNDFKEGHLPKFNISSTHSGSSQKQDIPSISVNNEKSEIAQTRHTRSINLSESDEAIQELTRLQLSDIAEDPSSVELLLQNANWRALKSLVDSSFSTNLRWVVGALFYFMGAVPESWQHPQFPGDILTFIFFQVSLQYQNIIVSEALLYVERSFQNKLDFTFLQNNKQINDKNSSETMNSFSEYPHHNQSLVPLNEKSTEKKALQGNIGPKDQKIIQYCLVMVLGNLTNSTTAYTSISILEILSKLTACLMSTAKSDNCSDIDLSFIFSPFPINKYETNDNALFDDLSTKKLLNALVMTMGSLSKSQNYSTQATDAIAFITSTIDEKLLMDHRLDFTATSDNPRTSKSLKVKNSFSDQIKYLKEKPGYNQIIWLLKATRESLANFIFYLPHKKSKSSSGYLKSREPGSNYSSPSLLAWSSLKICKSCLECVDPQIRLLAGQVLILALQYNKGVVSSTVADFGGNSDGNDTGSDSNIGRAKSIKISLPELDLSINMPLTVSAIDIALTEFSDTRSYPPQSQPNELYSRMTKADSHEHRFSSKHSSPTEFIFSETDQYISESKSIPRSRYRSKPTEGILTDSAFASMIREIFKLLVTPVTTNSYCSYLIANNFIKSFISKNSLSSQVFVLKVVNGVYSSLLSILPTLSPFLGQSDELQLKLSMYPPDESAEPELEASTVFETECKSFMQNLYLVSTIYGHCLRLIAEESTSSLPLGHDNAPSNHLQAYVLSTINDQKAHDFWCSEMDLDVFSPLMSWLTHEKPFLANSNIGTTWDSAKIKQLIGELALRSKDVDMNLLASNEVRDEFVYDEFLTTLNRRLYANYPDIFSKIKDRGGDLAVGGAGLGLDFGPGFGSGFDSSPIVGAGSGTRTTTIGKAGNSSNAGSLSFDSIMSNSQADKNNTNNKNTSNTGFRKRDIGPLLPSLEKSSETGAETEDVFIPASELIQTNQSIESRQIENSANSINNSNRDDLLPPPSSQQLLEQALELGMETVEESRHQQTPNMVGASDLKFALNDGFANINMSLLAGDYDYDSVNNALAARSIISTADSELDFSLPTDSEDESDFLPQLTNNVKENDRGHGHGYSNGSSHGKEKTRSFSHSRKKSTLSGWGVRVDNLGAESTQTQVESIFDLLKI